jgi:quinoprotein relay system zinc metallohydrolase 2
MDHMFSCGTVRTGGVAMFEALITVCLSLSEGPCRDQLLPGYEASSFAACEAALTERPPVIGPEMAAKGEPFCRAAGPALALDQIAPGVFAHKGLIEEPDIQNKGDVSNLGFIIGQNSVAVIDTGSARWIGEGVWRAIRAETDLPVSHVILTHMHPDHVFGAAPLAESGAQVLAHAGLARALADRQENYLESLSRLIGPAAFLGTRAVPVDIAVADSLTIDLGGRVLSLRAWPIAHTGADLTVVDDATGTMFTGDLVFHQHTPALDGRLLGWRAVLGQMAEMNVTQIVPGHGGPLLDWPGGGTDQARYLDVLETDTRAAVEAGTRLGTAVEDIAQSEASLWQLFDAYNPRNATVAFTELEWE